jgi:hypothetical protein
MILPSTESAYAILIGVTLMTWGLGLSRARAHCRPIALFLSGLVLEQNGRAAVNEHMLVAAYLVMLLGAVWLAGDILAMVLRKKKLNTPPPTNQTKA